MVAYNERIRSLRDWKVPNNNKLFKLVRIFSFSFYTPLGGFFLDKKRFNEIGNF